MRDVRFLFLLLSLTDIYAIRSHITLFDDDIRSKIRIERIRLIFIENSFLSHAIVLFVYKREQKKRVYKVQMYFFQMNLFV